MCGQSLQSTHWEPGEWPDPFHPLRLLWKQLHQQQSLSSSSCDTAPLPWGASPICSHDWWSFPPPRHLVGFRCRDWAAEAAGWDSDGSGNTVLSVPCGFGVQVPPACCHGCWAFSWLWEDLGSSKALCTKLQLGIWFAWWRFSPWSIVHIALYWCSTLQQGGGQRMC